MVGVLLGVVGVMPAAVPVEQVGGVVEAPRRLEQLLQRLAAGLVGGGRGGGGRAGAGRAGQGGGVGVVRPVCILCDRGGSGVGLGLGATVPAMIWWRVAKLNTYSPGTIPRADPEHGGVVDRRRGGCQALQPQGRLLDHLEVGAACGKE